MIMETCQECSSISLWFVTDGLTFGYVLTNKPPFFLSSLKKINQERPLSCVTLTSIITPVTTWLAICDCSMKPIQAIGTILLGPFLKLHNKNWESDYNSNKKSILQKSSLTSLWRVFKWWTKTIKAGCVVLVLCSAMPIANFFQNTNFNVIPLLVVCIHFFFLRNIERGISKILRIISHNAWGWEFFSEKNYFCILKIWKIQSNLSRWKTKACFCFLWMPKLPS